MRFRVLFIAFNIVLLISFLMIFLMPGFVLGWDYSSVFWQTNWPVAAIFVVVLLSLNLYFVLNWRVFTLLEREAWEELTSYLESRMEKRGKISRSRARILVNSYVVSGRIDKITGLEQFLRDHQPDLIPRLAMELGVPHLLSKDADEMAGYFEELVDSPQTAHPLWVRWSYGFGLMSQAKLEEARAQLMVVLEESNDLLLQPLAAHMLEPFGSRDEETAIRVRETRQKLADRYRPEKFQKELERGRHHLHVLVLASRIEDAHTWIFA
jgi:hypothetical protein